MNQSAPEAAGQLVETFRYFVEYFVREVVIYGPIGRPLVCDQE